MTKISIFHIDDHKIFSQGLSSLLANESFIEWFGHSNDQDLGKEKVSQLQPDIVLMDYFLPGKSGIELGKEIMKLTPRSKLVLLTMENDFLVVEMAKEAGFSGFIPKTAEWKVLLKIQIDVAAGIQVFPAYNIPRNEENEDLSKLNKLSKREREIALMVKRGFTSNEIADKLFISLLTVNTHRRNLIKKLGLKNIAKLFAFLNTVKNDKDNI